MREIIINKNDSGQRLDKFLLKKFKTLPPPLMYRFLRQKKIKLNGKKAEGNTVLQEGDVLRLFISDEFFNEKKSSEEGFMKLTPRIDIIYEDENIMLVDKRPGMIVHSDDNEVSDTLIDHIKAYLYQNGEYRPETENSFAPALCNRIDRNTGGIVIAAKNAEALRIINEKIKNNELSKSYLCVVHGYPEKNEATLSDWLVKDEKTNTVKVYSKRPNSKNAKTIITKYSVIKKKDGLSLLKVDLITGRTHQIRAHMSYIGHPLLGDGKYGINKDDKRSGYKFQALYSYKLKFAFKEPSGILEYLNGRSFKADEEKIWFLKDFK